MSGIYCLPCQVFIVYHAGYLLFTMPGIYCLPCRVFIVYHAGIIVYHAGYLLLTMPGIYCLLFRSVSVPLFTVLNGKHVIRSHIDIIDPASNCIRSITMAFTCNMQETSHDNKYEPVSTC